MIKIDRESDEDIASEVLPPVIPEKAIPIELNQLEPWHRPRKQFIRERQWLYHVKRLVGSISGTHWLAPQLDGRKEIKYLTLPGIDYFDVKMIAEYCRSEGILVTSTGYLSGADSNPYVARAKIRETALIDAKYISIHSHTSNRRLEEVSHDKGTAYAELEKRGPFHIVNIDACGSISPASNNDAQRLVNAIYKIVEYQLSLCTGRWLLFLTTDARTEFIAPETLKNFTKAILANAKASEEFASATKLLFSKTEKDLNKALEKARTEKNEKFIRFFSLGFSKWLLHLAEKKGWKMKVHSSFFYSTERLSKPRPSMPCLAFEFIPPDRSLEDPNKVATVAPAEKGHEFDMSMRALEKISKMENLDIRLENDDDLRLELAEATEKLLKDAGYTASAIADLDIS